MSRIKLFLVIITATAILAMVFAGVSCTTPVEVGDTDQPGQLAYITWILLSYGDPDNVTPAVPDAQITLTFRTIHMSFDGFGGVNNYGGNYEVDGDKLTITNIISTQLLGQEPLMGQEITYFRILHSAQTYQVAGEMLTITGTEGILVFTEEN
jgi:heat shock protein HslJ